MFIELTGTGGTNTNLIVPSNKKLYFIYNNTSSGQVTVKVSGQTGVSVANGTKVVLVCNGTDIVAATSYLIAPASTPTNGQLLIGNGSGFALSTLTAGTGISITNGAGSITLSSTSLLSGNTSTTITALGVNAGDSVTTGTGNTAVGYNAGTAITSGTYNTLVGENAGAAINTSINNTIVGWNAGSQYSRSSNSYFGVYAGYNINASENCAFGLLSLSGSGGGAATGSNNCAFGNETLYSITSGSFNTAVGAYAGDAITSGESNSLFGRNAGGAITSGFGNTCIGQSAGNGITTANTSTALGDTSFPTGNYYNSTCLGYGSSVDGNNQVQLGNSSTNSYYYSSISARSDARDKTEIQDTQFGLDFIMALRPRDFKWDMREDYRTDPPVKPSRADYADETAYEAAVAQWQADYANWETENSLANLTHDGTHTRSRFHQGLIAQEVKQVMDSMGLDFGGYQDHKINGGDDVLSISYVDLVAPLIKAIQELKAEFDAYKSTHP